MLMSKMRSNGFVDLPTLVTELQFRGLDQDKIDSTLRCLVHVNAVQNQGEDTASGILVEDIVNTYPMEVVQAASSLFLDKVKNNGLESFQVKWGFEDTAKTMERELWNNVSGRWNDYVATLNERYLGFFLPMTYEGARVVTTWKLRNDLKWFSVEIPSHGWNVLRLIEDVTAVAWKLDLAFGYRPFGPEGILGERVLLHKKAFDSLKHRAVLPPENFRTGIKLWRFFSEYDVNATDFVQLMKDCDLSLEEVQNQVKEFFQAGLTSQYREGQYPPYFVTEKKNKEFAAAVRELLAPMDSWLLQQASSEQMVPQQVPGPIEADAPNQVQQA